MLISRYKEVPCVFSIRKIKKEYSDVMYTPAADAKVVIKDLFNSAEVNYTPELENQLEQNAMDAWEEDFDNP